MYLLTGIVVLILAWTPFPYATMCSRAGLGATLLGSVIAGIVISVVSFAAFTVKAWWTLKPDQVCSPQPHIMQVNQPASNVAVLGAAFAPALGTLVLSPKGVTPSDALAIGFAGGMVFIAFAFAFSRALKLARRMCRQDSGSHHVRYVVGIREDCRSSMCSA